MAWCSIVASIIVLFILRGEIKQQHFATQHGIDSYNASGQKESSKHSTSAVAAEGEVEEEKNRRSKEIKTYRDVDDEREA
jgi:hypothetical protein